jgi:hypothetical protein
MLPQAGFSASPFFESLPDPFFIGLLDFNKIVTRFYLRRPFVPLAKGETFYTYLNSSRIGSPGRNFNKPRGIQI